MINFIVCLLIGYLIGNVVIEIKRKMLLNKSIRLMNQPNRWEWVRIQNGEV